jgi:uncharacterized protein YceK
MKRAFVLLMVVFLFSGCGAAVRESGFYEHSNMYKSWDHMKFSMTGYKEVSPDEAKRSKEEGWWGVTVE